jgi:hypothetical protein
MLDETEYFAGKAEALLEKAKNSTATYTEQAHAYATLALVHAVNQLNETLKTKTVVQKSSKQQE